MSDTARSEYFGVGDIILHRGYGLPEHVRVWEVVGIHLGGLGVENMIAIRPLDRKPGWDSKTIDVMHVPEVLLENVERFKPVASNGETTR